MQTIIDENEINSVSYETLWLTPILQRWYVEVDYEIYLEDSISCIHVTEDNHAGV